MLAELGQFTLALGMVCSLLLAFVPLYGAYKNNQTLERLAQPFSYLQFIFITISFLILVTLFVIQDFSVTYVWQHSNQILPVRYRISATWGAHEGSMLMWLMVQAIWTGAVAWFSKSLTSNQAAKVLSCLLYTSPSPRD